MAIRTKDGLPGADPTSKPACPHYLLHSIGVPEFSAPSQPSGRIPDLPIPTVRHWSSGCSDPATHRRYSGQRRLGRCGTMTAPQVRNARTTVVRAEGRAGPRLKDGHSMRFVFSE